MRTLFLSMMALWTAIVNNAEAKDLVAYFSAQGHTRAVAERIAELTGADLYRIEAADPYAANPYDDSERIQNEAYNNLRPAVANPPSQEWINRYDRIFVGSPCWWHQPAMVVCTFLETYDLSSHVIVPFFTYGATTYLNESMQTIYRSTPASRHIPETLPEDLDPDDITRPGRPDDAGIDMPGDADGVEGWLTRLGLIGDSAVGAIAADDRAGVMLTRSADTIDIEIAPGMGVGRVALYDVAGTLLYSSPESRSHSVVMPVGTPCLLSMVYDGGRRRLTEKLIF